MNVEELLEFLHNEVTMGNIKESDPVKIAIQPGHPMEYSTAVEPAIGRSADGEWSVFIAEHGGEGNNYLPDKVAAVLWG